MAYIKYITKFIITHFLEFAQYTA